MREEFNRQMEAKKVEWPLDLEAHWVERWEDDKYGSQVRVAGLIEKYTANTPEEVRTFGNRMKLEAANSVLFNVMITVANKPEIPPRVYPRKPPPSLPTKEDLFKTTDEHWRDRVQRDLIQAKHESQGVGDFDKKPDVEDYIENLLDEGEPELDEG